LTEYSRFFGGPEGSVPEYTQPEFAEVLSKIFTDGVFSDIDNELEVVETDPDALAVRINTGEAWIQGFWYQNTAYLTKSLAAADPDNDRIDRIVLRLDTTTNFKISIEVLTGTPAGSPSAPALTQTASIYEISLAQILVEEDATSVSDAKITDERTFANVTGAETNTPGENLLVNSAFVDTNEDGVPDWWTVLLTPTVAIAADTLCGFNDNHKQITITSTGAGYEGMVITQNTWLKVRPSTAYTFSIYYKCTAEDTGYIHIHSYNAAVEGTAHAAAEVTATTATRYTVTFTTDADATNLFIELATKADGDICIFSHPKLEIGSIVTAYNTSDKLKQISFGPLAFNLDFSTAVPATLTETNGDADQVPLKSVAFTKSDVAFLSPEFDIPITFSGLPILISYRFYAAAASKTHTMEVAFVSRGLSDAKDGAVGSFTAFAQDASDGTTGDEQINEKLFTAAELGWVAGEEIAMYLRRKNEGGDDTDEVYIKGIKFQYIEV